jgi:hypothetical protein
MTLVDIKILCSMGHLFQPGGAITPEGYLECACGKGRDVLDISNTSPEDVAAYFFQHDKELKN